MRLSTIQRLLTSPDPRLVKVYTPEEFYGGNLDKWKPKYQEHLRQAVTIPFTEIRKHKEFTETYFFAGKIFLINPAAEETEEVFVEGLGLV